MPTISKGDTVLVSGASGFIAVHVVDEFLKSGYKVVGTVRSEEKGQYLQNLFKGKQFSYVLVDDITKDGAFDEAVKGVQGVAHTASPFYVENVDDPNELIEPAYKGTTGVLKSIQKNNPDVKRVVITSSVAAIWSSHSKPAPYRYTEKDWNEDSEKEIEEKGKEASGGDKYQASKTIAEKSLWDFIEKEKPTWEGVAINPPLVLGPIMHQCDSPEKLNTSVANFYAYFAGKKSESDLPAPGSAWINVVNVAQAHVRALEVAEAAGERFITSNGVLSGQGFVDVIHKHFPDLPNVPVGKPGTHDEAVKDSNVFIGDKAAKVLGLKYIDWEDTIVEMAKSVKERFGP